MHRRTGGLVLTMAAAAAVSIGLSGQAPRTFAPDWTFKGSALTGMQQVGTGHLARRERRDHRHADRARTAAGCCSTRAIRTCSSPPRTGARAECTAGIMVRSEKGADGTKGVYTVISGDERSTAAVTVDAQGQHRQSRTADAQCRRSGAVRAASCRRRARRRGRAGGGGRPRRSRRPRRRSGRPRSSRCSRRRRSRPYKPNDWNRVEVLVDVDVFRSNVNGRGSAVAIDGTTGTLRSGRAPCRRHRRGAVQGHRHQGSRRGGSRRPSRSARASARSTSRTSTTAGRRRRATSTTTACST